MIKNTKDFFTGLIYIFFGVSALLISRDYQMGTATKMGAAYFPVILGGLIIFIGIISFVRSFMSKGVPIDRFAIRGLILILISTVLFGILLRGAGIIVAIPILVIVSAFARKGPRWVSTILLAAGLTVFCVLVFVKGLGIPVVLIGPWFGG